MHQAPNMIAERRLVPRSAAKARVSAIVNGEAKRGCTISDLSANGARLIFGALEPLPLRFELELGNGKRVRVQLIWQRKLAAGVRFDKPLAIWERIASRP